MSDFVAADACAESRRDSEIRVLYKETMYMLTDSKPWIAGKNVPTGSKRGVTHQLDHTILADVSPHVGRGDDILLVLISDCKIVRRFSRSANNLATSPSLQSSHTGLYPQLSILPQTNSPVLRPFPGTLRCTAYLLARLFHQLLVSKGKH